MINYLLKEAINDIEILDEYYSLQKISVKKHVDSKLKKYIYGVLIDRVFWSKALEKDGLSDKIEITAKEKEIFDRIIETYSVEEISEGISVSYKLRKNEDLSEYELDPQKANYEFSKLIQQPDILNDSMLIMLLVKYENAIAGLYRFLLEKYPQAYLSTKSITYSELISLDSDIEVVKERFISREIESFMRQAFSDWYDSFQRTQKVDFEFLQDEWNDFKEIYYRRNLVVHNQGIVNDVYLNNNPRCRDEIGKHLIIDKDYLSNAFTVTKKILIKTFWKMRKVANDKAALYKYLFEYGYSSMKKNEWPIAKYIFEMLLEEKDLSEVDRILTQVNLWISIKNETGVEGIKKEVLELDVSAMKAQFSAAKYALVDDYKKVTEYLEEALKEGVPVFYIKDWPLLNQYRETDDFKDFVERHKELFDEEGYESNDGTVDTKEDIFTEIEDSVGIEDEDEI